jgi:hypothetical protein
MRKITGWIPEIIAGVIIISALFLFSGCTSAKAGELAIYLTREDIAPERMPMQSHIDTADSPLISMNDIITYNSQTHEIKLSGSAFERLTQMDIPVRGKSFVVCVDRKTLYWGAFWTPVSSISFDGVTIWKPLSLKEPHVITLSLGYPVPSFYQGEDPRNNPQALKSLEQAGKLITRLTLKTVDKLPRSMKGYELYSWPADNQWHYTLVTGTNRNKTTEEIVTGEDMISEAGWVRIQVIGVEEMKTVLSKLQAQESVFWLASPRSDQPSPGGINFSLPPAADIEVLKQQAGQNEVDLNVAGG